jgi:hypothetical protein
MGQATRMAFFAPAMALSGAPWANSARWRGILRAHRTHLLRCLLNAEGWESLFRTERAGSLGRQKGHQRVPILAPHFPARGPPTPTAVGLLKA